MKKWTIKGLLSASLALCLILGMLCAGAYADASISVTAGQSISNVEVYSTTDTIQSCTYLGDLPSGLSMTYTTNGIYLSGTATTAGNYTIQLSIQTSTGSATSNVYITVGAAVVPSAAPTVAPTATPNYSQVPTVTKNPTGETVEAGGSALFVARADNWTSFVWRIVSPDTTNTYTAEEAPWYFRGLTVSGYNTDTLCLENIPSSMNGWAVECRFINPAGSSFTTGAIIRVSGATGSTNDPTSNSTSNNSNNSTGTTNNNNNSNSTTGTNTGGSEAGVNTSISTPVISDQPNDVLASSGETVTLSVRATNPNTGLGTLTYQWYVSDTAVTDMEQAEAIDGANQSSYTVPEADGTKYYRVGVWVSRNGEKSVTAYSDWAEVTYSDQGISGSLLDPTTQTATPSPTAPVTAPPTETPDEGGSSNALVFYIVVAALALLAVGGILVYLAIVSSRKGKSKTSEDDYED